MLFSRRQSLAQFASAARAAVTPAATPGVPIKLEDLRDVQSQPAADHAQVLVFDQATAQWTFGGLGQITVTPFSSAITVNPPRQGVDDDYTDAVNAPGLVIGSDGNGSHGIVIGSSFAGGDDDGADGHFDSTGRLTLYSYQRAKNKSYGETIRNYLMRWDAKAMTAWYGPAGLYDTNGDAVPGLFLPWAWSGAHYESAEHTGIHAHWEVEVPDLHGSLQGRFEIDYGDSNPVSPTYGRIGMDKTFIGTNLADLVVRTHGTDTQGKAIQQVFRLSGQAGFPKDITFDNDFYGSKRRWAIRVTGDAETGGQAGSNLQVLRYDDTGAVLDRPLAVDRRTGTLTVGDTTGSTGGLVVNRATGDAVKVHQTGHGANAIDLTAADSTGWALKSRVDGDAVTRFALRSDGRAEWGDAVDQHDTALYRSAAATLRTDGGLSVGGALTLGQPLAPGSVASYDFGPADHGLLAWAYDPIGAVQPIAPVSGVLQVVRVRLPVASTVSRAVLLVGTAGSGLQSGQSRVALYTATGALLGVSADQSAAWTSTGVRSAALTGLPSLLPAGTYCVVAWSAGNHPPAFQSGLAAAAVNLGLPGATARFATADAGITTRPPNQLGSSTPAAASFWVGLA